MAQTRGATGNSKPRVFPTISTEPARKPKKTTGTKKTTTKPKAAGAVAKKRGPATQRKRKSTIATKIEGAADEVVGTMENKPGKKAAGAKKLNGSAGKTSKTTKAAKV